MSSGSDQPTAGNDREEQHLWELLCDRTMPGLERDTVGGWTIRAGLGVTGRSNSAWPSGPREEAIGHLVARIERWFDERAIVPCFQVFGGEPTDLLEELDRRSYRDRAGSLVMSAARDDVEAVAPGSPSGDITVAVSECCPDEFSAVVGDERRVAEMTACSLPQRFAVARDGTDQVVGIGSMTIDGAFAGIFGMRTEPCARRRGVARRVVGALLAAAPAAETVWLQVEPTNEPALALYRSMGFVTVHSYEYRVRSTS